MRWGAAIQDILDTASLLTETLGLDGVHLRSLPPGTISDEQVVALAKDEGRVTITFDNDFGQIYHFRERGTIGVIHLQLRDQTVKSPNRVLTYFFREQTSGIDLDTSLVVLEIDKVRVVTVRSSVQKPNLASSDWRAGAPTVCRKRMGATCPLKCADPG